MKQRFYIQYFQKVNGEYIEPCGDRQLVILDGRNSLDTMINDGFKYNGYRRPVYDAFQIRKGTFTNYKNLSKIIERA